MPAWKSAKEAIDSIRSGMTVSVANMNGEPLTLTAELWSRGDRLSDVTILTGLMFTGYKFMNSSSGFNLRTWFIPGTVKGGPSKRIKAEYLPISWAQVSPYLEDNASDVALLQVSPADANGFHSFGTSTSHARSMLKGARLKIAEVNRCMPRTCGDSLVHASEFDVLVKADYPILENPFRDGDSIDRAIGLSVARLIPSGSTLQFGIGTIPAAVIDGLIDVGARDLSVVSQLIDPVRKLVDAGCCTTNTVKARVAGLLPVSRTPC